VTWADPDAAPDEVIERLRSKVARLEGRWSLALHALCSAPKVPSSPRTPFSRWFRGIRYVAIRGERDRLADAMDLVGREIRREEVYGCCERHPMPPLVPSVPNPNQDGPPVLPPHLR
jgi:hypothetical protein